VQPQRLVATLVANPARPAVTDAVVAAAARALGHDPQVAILAREIAADLMFEGVAAEAEARIRASLEGAPVDVIVQPHANRRKRLFLADMDSTMIGQECIDELADYVGLKAEVSGITERAMRGEIAFEPALRERVALLKGLPLSVSTRSSPRGSPSCRVGRRWCGPCGRTAPTRPSFPAASPSSQARSRR
jgi:phosphoserine phosphatase